MVLKFDFNFLKEEFSMKYFFAVVMVMFFSTTFAELFNKEVSTKLISRGINNIEILTKVDFIIRGKKHLNESLMNNSNIVFEIKGDFNNNKKTDWILSCKSKINNKADYYLLFMEYSKKGTNILNIVKQEKPCFIIKDKTESNLISIGYNVDSDWMDYYVWDVSNYVITNLRSEEDVY
jgi:hypothetical protein